MILLVEGGEEGQSGGNRLDGRREVRGEGKEVSGMDEDFLFRGREEGEKR